ncbi:MAG: AAA family ATPase [Magnetococcales bacterium]|nr:AAA family ATPase [Magnetococcales bacterium]
MRIDELNVKNFKGFNSQSFRFHPRFNLLIGGNGTGKTAVLDALSVALGSWFLGLRGFDTRHIRQSEVRLLQFGEVDPNLGERSPVHWEQQFPSTIEAVGQVMERDISWLRALNGQKSRTTWVEAKSIKTLSSQAADAIRGGEPVALPLISYYGTGRLWDVPNEQPGSSKYPASKEQTSRLSAYRTSVDPRLSVSEIVRWITDQTYIKLQRGVLPPLLKVVRQAMIQCLEGGEDLFYSVETKEIHIQLKGAGYLPFGSLSDGQRAMLAMVADMARKAAILNPHLGERALQETRGVVLIDELDLHLHPRWQRHVIRDLMTVFPGVQFIATTHSPFLVQSLDDAGMLLPLEGETTASLGNLGIETIAAEVMGVGNPEASPHYWQMLEVAKEYLAELDEAASSPRERLETYKKRLAERLAPFAHNPAFQAVLELERAARLGE